MALGFVLQSFQLFAGCRYIFTLASTPSSLQLSTALAHTLDRAVKCAFHRSPEGGYTAKLHSSRVRTPLEARLLFILPDVNWEVGLGGTTAHLSTGSSSDSCLLLGET